MRWPADDASARGFGRTLGRGRGLALSISGGLEGPGGGGGGGNGPAHGSMEHSGPRTGPKFEDAGITLFSNACTVCWSRSGVDEVTAAFWL